MIKRSIKEVDTHDTKRLLVLDISFIKHPHMDDNLAWFSVWLGLKSHTKPAVGFIVVFKTARRDRVSENKKCFLGSEFCVESLHEKAVFVVKHCLKTNTADITVGRPINRVAESHVVGRHRFGDCACRTAYLEESTRHFLAPPAFGARALSANVQINLESLLISGNLHFRVHTISVVAISDRRKSEKRRAEDCPPYQIRGGRARHSVRAAGGPAIGSGASGLRPVLFFKSEAATGALARRPSLESNHADCWAALHTPSRRARLGF